jgi:uncharacterized membrane protein YgaE (UPF0421/DUF939 family)
MCSRPFHHLAAEAGAGKLLFQVHSTGQRRREERKMDLRPSAPITALQLSLRAAVAAAAAVALAKLLKLEYPVYALIAAVLVMDLSPLKTRQLAAQRLLGTLLGATVGALLSYVLPEGPLAMGVGILTAMLLGFGIRLEAGAVKLAGYVCGLVVFAYGALPWSYAFHRVAETLLGIGMAVLVSLVPKLLGVQLPSDAAGPSDL